MTTLTKFNLQPLFKIQKLTAVFGLLTSAPYAMATQASLPTTSVSSAEPISTPPLSTAPTSLDLVTTLGSLVLVIGLILGLAWLLKRMQVPAIGQQKGMRIVSQLTVGPKERIAVIQVGEEQFLIGITPQSIQTLAKLEQPLDEQELSNRSFASQFSQLMKKHDKE